MLEMGPMPMSKKQQKECVRGEDEQAFFI